MLRYIANRVLTIIPTLFVVSVVVFGLQQMLPGDAAIALAGENMDPAIVAQIRATHHLTSRSSFSTRCGSARCCAAISVCRCATTSPSRN